MIGIRPETRGKYCYYESKSSSDMYILFCSFDTPAFKPLFKKHFGPWMPSLAPLFTLLYTNINDPCNKWSFRHHTNSCISIFGGGWQALSPNQTSGVLRLLRHMYSVQRLDIRFCTLSHPWLILTYCRSKTPWIHTMKSILVYCAF